MQLEAIKHPHSTVSASCRFFCKYAVISCVVCKASKEVKIAVKTVQDTKHLTDIFLAFY